MQGLKLFANIAKEELFKEANKLLVTIEGVALLDGTPNPNTEITVTYGKQKKVFITDKQGVFSQELIFDMDGFEIEIQDVNKNACSTKLSLKTIAAEKVWAKEKAKRLEEQRIQEEKKAKQIEEQKILKEEKARLKEEEQQIKKELEAREKLFELSRGFWQCLNHEHMDSFGRAYPSDKSQWLSILHLPAILNLEEYSLVLSNLSELTIHRNQIYSTQVLNMLMDGFNLTTLVVDEIVQVYKGVPADYATETYVTEEPDYQAGIYLGSRVTSYIDGKVESSSIYAFTFSFISDHHKLEKLVLKNIPIHDFPRSKNLKELEIVNCTFNSDRAQMLSEFAFAYPHCKLKF